MASAEASFLCGICNDNFTSSLKVLPCGHVLCDTCWTACQDAPITKGKCPYCRYAYKARENPYPLFAELHVVKENSTSDIIQRTRQRVEHVVDGLVVMKSPEELREIYNEARILRAEARNAASASKNADLKTMAVLLTNAVDAAEDNLLYSMEEHGLAGKARDAAKQLIDQKKSHEQEVRGLKETVSKLKRKQKVDEEEQKVTATRLAEYKKKYQDALSEQSIQTKRSAESAARLNELRKEHEKTKEEHKRFQSQLSEHKANETKYKLQLRQLKQELKSMKEKEEQSKTIAVAKTMALSSGSPDRTIQDESQLDSPSIINLCSSSPAKTPAAPSKKRPRAPEENQYKRSNDVGLLPPPKVRAAGPSRIRSEVLEKVSVDANGGLKRKPTSLAKPKASSDVLRPVQAPSKSAGPQLSLGKGGKLVGIATKRVRAV